MATLFREVTYRTQVEDARVAALDRLDARPDLRGPFERHRRLGPLERDRRCGVEHHIDDGDSLTGRAVVKYP